jgi:hypothetical protein
VDSVRLRRLPAPPPELGWWERSIKRLVLIHKTDDQTVRGYVKEVAPDGVLLGQAEYLPDQGPAMPLGGEVFIPREIVGWVQLLPAPANP